MWNSNYLTKLAEKAQQAAASVEAQLNDSVGAVGINTSSSAHGSNSSGAYGNAAAAMSVHDEDDIMMDDDDDFFGDNDDDDVGDPGRMDRGFDATKMPVNGDNTIADIKTNNDAPQEEEQIHAHATTPPEPPLSSSSVEEALVANGYDDNDGWNNDEVDDIVIDFENGEQDHNAAQLPMDHADGSATLNENPKTTTVTLPLKQSQDEEVAVVDEEENHYHPATAVASDESTSPSPIPEKEQNQLEHVTHDDAHQDNAASESVVAGSTAQASQAMGKEPPSNLISEPSCNYNGMISSLEGMGFERDQINNAIQQCNNHDGDMQVLIAFILENGNDNKVSDGLSSSSSSPAVVSAVAAEKTQNTISAPSESLFDNSPEIEVANVEDTVSPSADALTPDPADKVSDESLRKEIGKIESMISEVISDENSMLAVEEPSTVDIDNVTKENDDKGFSNADENICANVGFVSNQIGEVAAQLLLEDQCDQEDVQNSIEMNKRIREQSLEIENLRKQLSVREDQLRKKSMEMANLNDHYESELDGLKSKVAETKAEAKRRILKAKERVEDMQKRLAAATATAQDDENKDAIIEELRKEGSALAQQQSTFEQSIRLARKDVRDLSDSLEDEKEKNGALEGKVKAITDELRETSKRLDLAKEGQKRALKLEEELDKKSEELVSNVSLQRSLKEKVDQLRVELAISKDETEKAKQGLISKGEQESERLKKEKDDLYKDLEAKLRMSEKEANLREDALRHEVSELRKRWQDAVRRADALSLDVQESTAPLMRQLESSEKQNRVRAAAWAEIESKLRSQLESITISNEKLEKDISDLKSSSGRATRLLQVKEEECIDHQQNIKIMEEKIMLLQKNLDESESRRHQLMEEKASLESLSSEEVMKTKNEMMKMVVESEERYRLELDQAEQLLKEERRKYDELEILVEDLRDELDSSKSQIHKDEFEKDLEVATDQAAILLSTLNGLTADDTVVNEKSSATAIDMNGGSFAAMEQLSQGLNCTKKELASLRKQLTTSEAVRRDLVVELNQLRSSSEKIPELERRVEELTWELDDREQEIQGLHEDIMDIKNMYRDQLNSLLEEKLVGSTPLNTPMKNNCDLGTESLQGIHTDGEDTYTDEP
mmetsp:Transcript_24419/g.37679  ORF Transcript_24419/g.37679 Transcript_24419/m.37679 type:complete len:1125 (+) Transcript_24419:75-3449(+)